jgi:hypothetical protein
MSTRRLKLVIAGLLLVAAGIAVAAVTVRLGEIVERAETGADPADAFTSIGVPVDSTEIRWLPDAPLPRAMEETTREAIADAYLLSLAVLASPGSYADDDLPVHLTGPALAAARTEGSSVIATTPRRHQLGVVFYSADGQIVEFFDTARSVLTANGRDGFVRTEKAVTVMVLVDGVWHLRHRVVIDGSIEPLELETLSLTELTYPTAEKGNQL